MKKINSKTASYRQEKYSIHTLTFRVRLTKRDWNAIKEKLIQFSRKKNKGFFEEKLNTKTTYKFINYNVASCFGFNKVSLLEITSENSDTSYWMDIKINPRRMFHKDDHPFVYIATKKELVSSYKRIGQFLEKVGITEINCDIFYITRADYCVNIHLGDEEHVKEYMRLMKKGSHPYSSKRRMEYSGSGKRKIPTKDSFTVYTDSFEFSVYDKYIQLTKEIGKYSEEEIQEAEGIVRIELRVTRSKINYDARKRGYKNTKQFLAHAGVIAGNNIPRYLKKAYGSGRFVKLKEAKQIVNDSCYKYKCKDELIKILKKTSKGNLQDVKLSYGKGFSKYMKKFNELGISPITIEKRSKIEEFPNPLYFIEHKNKNFG